MERRADPDSGRRLGRRAILRGTAGVLGAAGVAAIAGCTTTLPPLGQRVSYGRVDAPERDQPVYRRWIPEPSAIRTEYEDADEDLASGMYSTPGNLGAATIGSDFSLGTSILKSRIDYFGFDLAHYDWTLSIDGGAVLRGDLDRARVERTLTETVYRHVDEYAGFDVYERSPGTDRVAVSPTTIVQAAGPYARSNLEAIVDAGQGTVPRHHEVNEDLDRFFERLGAAPFTWFGVDFGDLPHADDGPDLPEPIIGATSFDVDEAAAYFTYDVLYPAGEMPSKANVREYLERDARPQMSTAVDVDRDAHFLRVEMRVPGGKLRARSAGETTTPYVTWRTEYDATEEVVVFHHEAGDRVEPTSLSIRHADSDAVTFRTGDGEIGPSDAVVVDVSGADHQDDLHLVWSNQDESASATIAAIDLEEAREGGNDERPTTGDGGA